jgi:isoquinoline 1-oxidoreductase alpha subunit
MLAFVTTTAARNPKNRSARQSKSPRKSVWGTFSTSARLLAAGREFREMHFYRQRTNSRPSSGHNCASTFEESVVAKLNVNGKVVDYTADEGTPLLWVLREQLGLTGTKYGCGIAQCGACTVHIDGVPTRSCTRPASAVKPGEKIVTIEGLSKDGTHPVQKAWVALDVPQCGFCQSGMIMAATALLQKTPKPSDAQIDAEITNICRCGTFQQVREAIHAAAKA